MYLYQLSKNFFFHGANVPPEWISRRMSYKYFHLRTFPREFRCYSLLVASLKEFKAIIFIHNNLVFILLSTRLRTHKYTSNFLYILWEEGKHLCNWYIIGFFYFSYLNNNNKFDNEIYNYLLVKITYEDTFYYFYYTYLNILYIIMMYLVMFVK